MRGEDHTAHTILLLDDDEDALDFIPEWLKERYRIVHFRDEDGIFQYIDGPDFSQNSTIGLIDVDLNVDDNMYAGIDVIIDIYMEEIFFPVVFISHDNRKETQNRAADVGPYAYIDKTGLSDDDGSALSFALSRAEGALYYRRALSISPLSEWGRKAVMLVGSLDHEIGQVLQSINARCASILAASDIELIRDLSGRLEGNVTTFSQLLSATFSYIKTGQPQLSYDQLDIVTFVEQYIESNSGKNLAIYTEEERGSLSCQVAPVRLKQILSNLVTNASKYGELDGEIGICISKTDTFIQIFVKNFGRAIESPRKVRKLFVPRFRGDPEDGKPGDGIGLAVVKEIAKMYGGTAFHEPFRTPDGREGNIFGVRLPLDLTLIRSENLL